MVGFTLNKFKSPLTTPSLGGGGELLKHAKKSLYYRLPILQVQKRVQTLSAVQELITIVWGGGG